MIVDWDEDEYDENSELKSIFPKARNLQGFIQQDEKMMQHL